MAGWQMWVVAGVLLLIAEMITPSAFFVSCFGVSAFAAALLAYGGVGYVGVWTVFCVLSLTLVILSRPLIRRFTKSPGKPSNVDALVGRPALVTEPIAPHKTGLVRVDGEVWSAMSEIDLSAGEQAVVLRVEGTKVVVTKNK